MKLQRANIIRLVCLIILLSVFACSKDEINSPLNGEWTAVSFITSEPVDENQDGVANTDLKLENDCVSMKADFTSRGRFSIVSSDAAYKVEIIDGKVVLIPDGCTSTSETGHWSLNENSTLLLLEFDIPGKDEPTLVEVKIELTDQRLVMKELPYNNGGSITYTVEFEKV